MCSFFVYLCLCKISFIGVGLCVRRYAYLIGWFVRVFVEGFCLCCVLYVCLGDVDVVVGACG